MRVNVKKKGKKKRKKRKEKYSEFTRVIAYRVIDYNYVRGTKIS